jgi:hypothetical protein
MPEEQASYDTGSPRTKEYSVLELIKCAEREVAKRKQVYPKLVADKRMSKATAAAEIGRMEAIVERLKVMARAEGWSV